MVKIFFHSSRPIHWVAIILNSIITTLICGGSFNEGLIIGLEISCIASFSFLINDVFDAKIDELNWEKRMSVLTKKNRIILALISFAYIIVSFSVSFYYNSNALYSLFVLTLILFGYNLLFKKILFIGNIIAAIALMSPIAIPYILYNTGYNPLIFVVIIGGILYNFSREIILDLVDTKGDSQNGRRTFPVVIGQNKSIALSISVFIIAFLLLVISPIVLRFNFNFNYNLLISVLFSLPLIISFYNLKCLIPVKNEVITLDNLKPFIFYSRVTLITFPLVLLIYYYLQS